MLTASPAAKFVSYDHFIFPNLKTSRGKVTIWDFGKLGTEAGLLSHGRGPIL